jgi:hypothetical protein
MKSAFLLMKSEFSESCEDCQAKGTLESVMAVYSTLDAVKKAKEEYSSCIAERDAGLIYFWILIMPLVDINPCKKFHFNLEQENPSCGCLD